MGGTPVRRSIGLDIPEEERASSMSLPTFAEYREFGFAALVIVIETEKECQHTLTAFGSWQRWKVDDASNFGVNLDENVDGSPYDVCLWHQEADQSGGREEVSF